MSGEAGAASANFSWMRHPPVAKIAAALDAREKGCARFVGGCVRDSLLGAQPRDFDIATTLEPQDVVDALGAAGLKAAPTGVLHGTVTGVADHVGVEITTLRADISTDGRRATVAFTRDWSTDASRRDFRLNAIYLGFDGALYDPVGGIDDARAGRVRFIGDPAARIEEDYLRILRFFRFSARFAGGFDAEGLAACAAGKSGIARLSAERIGDEFCKILAQARAPMAIDAMAAAGVLGEVWPHPARREAFALLKDEAPDACAPLGLATLWGEEGDGIDAALRLSGKNAQTRKDAIDAARILRPDMTPEEMRGALYRLGADAFDSGALVAGCRQGDPDAFRPLRALAVSWTPPHFPYTGKDVIAQGVKAGPDVARILKAVEGMWIAEDFPPADRLRAILVDQAAR